MVVFDTSYEVKVTSTIRQLIARQARSNPAIGARDKDWLTYETLINLGSEVRRELRKVGIGKDDRVAVVLPNGPEMATAFLTIAQSAVCAPLNPSYREEEFKFYYADLKARAVILLHDSDGPANSAADALGLMKIQMQTHPDMPAGYFSLSSDQHGRASTSNSLDPESEDTALILHTSGTTSRPKIVPLTHANLTNSAANIQQALELSERDRCMNIMPLFHIHGLIATVLSSISSGASVWCSSGFSALNFYQLLDEVKPSWYSAVPTMHQTILARSERNKTVIENSSLRLIRSSSASLPGPVMRQLSQTFRVPVIESYGMTEATHQMTSNPLTNGSQKPGSVGIPAGPDVAVADPANNRLIKGIGEIVISGKNVTPGYEGNASANEQSFFYAHDKRWFRTGDQGRFDEDGYLILTGRLKEIINRGGEKIGPLEVDGVISSHSDVLQVVTFAIPHPTLGEEVGAAIVLRDGANIAGKDLKAFCASSLSAFKIPSKIVFVDEIPKGATGKLQRIGLAEKLNLT